MADILTAIEMVSTRKHRFGQRFILNHRTTRFSFDRFDDSSAQFVFVCQIVPFVRNGVPFIRNGVPFIRNGVPFVFSRVLGVSGANASARLAIIKPGGERG